MWRHVVTPLAAAAGAFVGTALVLALLDLYIGGHGGTPLGARPLIDADAAGVHLSIADACALFAALCAAVTSAVFGRTPRS